MSIKAVLFDFNGVIINDEKIHEQLIEELLISENLRPRRDEFRYVCLGRSDRVCIAELLNSRYRVVTEAYLDQLIARKNAAYLEKLGSLEVLPIYPGLQDFILRLQEAGLKLAVVTGALRVEVENVLSRAGLAQYFSVVVAAEDVTKSKPAPDGYLMAVKRLNECYPELNLSPKNCLVFEDTPAGIQAGQQAGMPVVGVANSYPFHMIHRQATWVIDRFADLELERVLQFYGEGTEPLKAQI
ncbi:HAD family phosphatase [Ancylothrix sp. C2]|uniref:HAD family hydrolase n=1 Tax=Ancylothrix sp. D3o TaxID=2953691 RepID=UPI0021BA6CAE|nr:HAD family phosphatase [Ancylothrix sp. D3o]MCT7948307.1 HAD family phosphatase [Ancylothrix sp. D3o]